MYRDAFRPRQDAGHTVETKEPLVTASRQPEQDNAVQDLNSDTATASSVTTSEPGISPKGEDLEKSQSGDSKVIVGDGEVTNKSNTDKTGKAEPAGEVGMAEIQKEVVEEHTASGRSDLKSELGSPKEEPLVKVKDEVQKIEGKVENGTEMTISNKVEADKKEKEIAYEEHTHELEPKLETGNEKSVSEKHVDVDIVNQKVEKEKIIESTDHVDGTTSSSSLVGEITSSGNENAKSESSAMVDESLPKKEELAIETLSEVKSVEPENIYVNNVNQTVSKKENQDKDQKEKHAETEQLSTDKDSKDTKLDLRIDKQFFPETSAPDTKKIEETEVLQTKENIEKRDTQTEDKLTTERKIEKTEDKVLETDVQSEVTEESFKKEMDTATVELSPTKEKPQGLDSAHKAEEKKLESSNSSQDISHIDVSDTGKEVLDKESSEELSSATVSLSQTIERPTMDEIPTVQDTKLFADHTATEKATDPEKKDISPTVSTKKVENSLIEEKEDFVLKSSSESQQTITEKESMANSKSEHETEEQPVPIHDTKITADAEKRILDVNDSINLQKTSSKESGSIDVDKHHIEDTEETMQLDETGKGAKTVKIDNHGTSDASVTVTDKSNKISEGTSKYDSETHGDQVDVNIVQKSEIEPEADIKLLADEGNKTNIHESKTEIKSIRTDSSKESESQIKSEKDTKESKDYQNVQVETNIPKQTESNEETKKSVVDTVDENKVSDKPIKDLLSKQDSGSITDTQQKNEVTEKQLDMESDQIKTSENADIELKSPKDSETSKDEETVGVSQEQTESLPNDQGSFSQERPKTETVESLVKSSIDPEQTKQDEVVTVSQDQTISLQTKQKSPDQATPKEKDPEKNKQDETMTISRTQIESEHKNNMDSSKGKDPEETKQDETMTVSRAQIESKHISHIDSPKGKDPEETKQDETMAVSRESEPKIHMDADQEVSKRTLANGDIKPVEDESLMKDKQAALPLTNGEIESPTDDTADQLPGTSEGDDSQMSMKMMRGEVSAKTTYQRTSTGPIAISEVDNEGKYITLENTSSSPNKRDVNLDGWRLKRSVDGKRDYIYPFRNFTLKSGKAVKILARKAAGQAGLNDLIFRDEDNWGVGSQVTTALVNDKDEEKATHVQKTLYN